MNSNNAKIEEKFYGNILWRQKWMKNEKQIVLLLKEFQPNACAAVQLQCFDT